MTRKSFRGVKAPHRRTIVLHFCSSSPASCDAKQRGPRSDVLHVRRWRRLNHKTFSALYASYVAQRMALGLAKEFWIRREKKADVEFSDGQDDDDGAGARSGEDSGSV